MSLLRVTGLLKAQQCPEPEGHSANPSKGLHALESTDVACPAGQGLFHLHAASSLHRVNCQEEGLEGEEAGEAS